MLFPIFQTLLYREVKRFLNVYNQTIISPVINSVLYFTIFTVVFGGKIAHEFDYKAFVAAGIIAMTMLQNAYSNTQSTMTTAKVLGFSVDMIVPPISTNVLVFSIMIGGVVRGLVVGGVSFLALLFFANIMPHNIGITLLYAIISCTLFSLIGVIVGALSKNFDSAISYNTYIINPLTFLSGTFYSISFLSPMWKKFILFNPVFYLIDGFRFGLIGFSEISAGFLPIFCCLMVIGCLYGLAYYFTKTRYQEL